MRCPVTSGRYQCEREQGHAGEHECSADEYAITIPAPAEPATGEEKGK